MSLLIRHQLQLPNGTPTFPELETQAELSVVLH